MCSPSEIARFPPWAVKKIEKAFNHALLLLLRPWVVLIKTDIHFPGCCRPSAGPTSAALEQTKDRAGRA